MKPLFLYKKNKGEIAVVTYERKQKLYRDYSIELDQYSEDLAPLTDEDIKRYCDGYISGETSSWKNIFSPDGEIVGFLIIGKIFPEKHPHSDYSISQSYVALEYRNHGLMTKRVSEYVQSHPGKYSLLVYKNNKKALEYWPKVFESIDYKPAKFAAEDDNVYDGGLILLGFEPKKKVKKRH